MKNWLGIFLILLVFAGGYIVYSKLHQSVATDIPTPGTSTDTNTVPTIIEGTPSVQYQNATYGFTMYRPATAESKTADFDGYLTVTATPIVAFALPKSLFDKTNLVEAGVYIGATSSPAVITRCTSVSNAENEKAEGTVTIHGTAFSVFTSSGAGAGNLYEEKTYRTVQNNQCFEIVELLHSGNIANYPKDTVTEFDHQQFSGILDAMVNSFTFSVQ